MADEWKRDCFLKAVKYHLGNERIKNVSHVLRVHISNLRNGALLTFRL